MQRFLTPNATKIWLTVYYIRYTKNSAYAVMKIMLSYEPIGKKKG
jgi:hypothetical protein